MINDITFPVGIPAAWVNPERISIPDAYLKNWLLDTGSLTERLQSHCRHFELQVLGQRPIELELEELTRLEIEIDSYNESDWQVREVILYGDNKPWVFARSILPSALCESDLAELGNQPLGQIIFNDSRFSRSPFELNCIVHNDEFLQTLKLQSNNPIWGRRSAFHYKHHIMTVAEFFLPSAPAYKHIPDNVQHDD